MALYPVPGPDLDPRLGPDLGPCPRLDPDPRSGPGLDPGPDPSSGLNPCLNLSRYPPTRLESQKKNS